MGRTQLKPIDREALVRRENVVLTAFDASRPVQVGNGSFAFGMDLTGLQTYVPFNTMADWAWGSGTLPPGEKVSNYHMQVVETHGRPIPYPLPDPQHPALSDWLAGNPHKINLGRVGLHLTHADGSAVAPSDLKNIRQKLDLWTGVVTSTFDLDGAPVKVKTACDPNTDSIGVQISSPLIQKGRIGAFFTTPGDDPRYMADPVGDWANPQKLKIEPDENGHGAVLLRHLDGETFKIGVHWDGKAALTEPPVTAQTSLQVLKAEYGAQTKWVDVTAEAQKAVSNGTLVLKVGNNLVATDPDPKVEKYLRITYAVNGFVQMTTAHENDVVRLDATSMANRIVLSPAKGQNTFAFTFTFTPGSHTPAMPTSESVFHNSRAHWPAFWKSGGVIDLSGSRDPRWKELQRRIVLSQYLMAVNEAGSLPPQESGLVNNTWYGRFHMEMLWWHAAHWALWNRWTELDKVLTIYKRLMPEATALAKKQGYLGARWPKCIGPNLREWPYVTHAFLAWQQPHPIFFANLDYRAHPTKATLKKWLPIVDATADFLSSFAFFDKTTGRYVLGPPIQVVSENVDPYTTMNPAFELGYWRFGLRTAIEWRRRMGLTPKPLWLKVLSRLSPIPVQDGVYVLHEGVKDMWTKFNFEHPALIGTYGLLPGDGVNVPTMRRTLDKVMATWDFNHTWGWDFPMLAMCAARLNEPDRAIDFLTTKYPGFQFDACGLATGGPYPYFPSNGGLLYAVAMMAAGWDGAPHRHAPGFPDNGMWKVRYEGLSPAP